MLDVYLLNLKGVSCPHLTEAIRVKTNYDFSAAARTRIGSCGVTKAAGVLSRRGRIAAAIPRHPARLPRGLGSGLSAVTREALEHHGRLDCGRGSLE